MMRSLWTAASGMNAQQMNVDTISNNLANVNTTGFKKERMEFKTLMYQTLQRADEDPANFGARPVNLQVGLGVRPMATARIFDQGNLTQTTSPTDFAIEGDGYFVIQATPDETYYTKDGSFKTSNNDGELTLVTSDGFPVLDINGENIIFGEEINPSTISVNDDGTFTYVDTEGVIQDLDYQLDLVQFSNQQGLEAVGKNFFRATVASGEPIQETSGDIANLSNVVQGYIERSNVAVADEMVDLIVAQRAYELNSKAIQASDEMLQNANNLRR
jgi:flagellar basal-body rod protein FlgG